MPRKSSIERVYGPVLRDLARVQRTIRREIRTPNRVVNKIVAYIFNTKGKLLRPAMALLAAHAVGQPGDAETHETLIQLGAAIELVHNASLVHDDILDDSAFRRHVPTLNRVYTSHIALLAGDALFSKAFFLMSHYLPKAVIEPITLVTEGMCHGELINSTKSAEVDFDTYLTVVRLKTASLMSVSAQAGAMVAGADPAFAQSMADYGMNVGIAYQMVDDYVDEETAEVNGFSLDYAMAAAARAREALAPIPETIFKGRLSSFVDLVLEMADQKDMSATVNLP